MKRVYLNDDWKESWKYCYPYDLIEVFGEDKNHKGYSYAYINRRDAAISCIESVVKPGAKILDIAAAQGNFSLVLAEKGYDVSWNDIRSDLVEYVQMKQEHGNISYYPGNVFDVHFKDKFDLVLITEIIEHVAHPDKFLKRISELVKPKGFIVMTTPLGSYILNNLPKFSEVDDASKYESEQFKPNSDGHIFLLHADEIRPLADKAGLDIVSMNYYTNPLTNGHLKLGHLLKILPQKWVFALDKLTQKLPKFIGKKIHTNFAVLFQRKD
jgi:2-polyprenyl-3-methyl-5-hydroxy-6-metoxy-1,4-benzoquinol methylase